MAAEGREVAPPPIGWAARIVVHALAPSAERADILADLADEAAAIATSQGRLAARRFVRWQLVHSALPWMHRRVRERARSVRSDAAMLHHGFITDLRLAARRLWLARGFTALAVATLAIGIAAVSTAFSLAYGLWLKPLPYGEPDRLVWIHARHVPSGSSAGLTGLELAEYQGGSSALSGVAGYLYGAGIARINGEPVRLVNHVVSPNLFRVLGVHPVIGRDFIDSDAGTPIVMLSHQAWATYYGRDPDILHKGVLLDDAAAMLRSLSDAIGQDRGYDPRGLQALNVTLPFANDEYPSPTIRAQVFDRMLERVRSVPGVRQAAATTGFPGSRLGILGGARFAPSPDAKPLLAAVHAATPGFFETMGIPLLAGRTFTIADTEFSPRVAIVNQQLASQFPGANPIGRRIPLAIFGETEMYEIVGVTGDIRLTDHVGYRVLVPIAQKSPYWIDLVFRADIGAAAMTAVRRSLRDGDPDLLIENESSFQAIIAGSLGLERTQSLFAATIGALAIAIAGVGLYSLLTFLAAQRRRELGIRLALGSQPRQLFRDVLGRALRLAIAGLAVGVVAAMALVRVLGSRVFGLTSVDATIYAAAAALVLIVAMIAAWLPARRVMRINPLLAMRAE